jgi:ATP synthase protein I
MDERPEAQDCGDRDARLQAIDLRLEELQEREQARKAPNGGAQADANYRLGNRVLTELIAGIGGGAFFGWVIDRFAGTRPWGLLVVMALGTIVAFRNIIRISTPSPDQPE